MAVAFVQRAESLNLGYVNISPTTNNLLCVSSTTSAGGGNPSITAISFFSAVNAGGTNLGSLTVPTSMATANDGTYWVTGAYGKVPAGTASVGVTYTGGLPGEVHLEAVELSGQDTTTPFLIGSMHQQLHPGTTTDAITSSTAVVSSAAYLLGICNNTNSDSDTVAGTGFTVRGTTTGAFCVEDATKSTSGTYAATFTAPTHGASDYYHTFMFAIKASGGTTYTLTAATGIFSLTGNSILPTRSVTPTHAASVTSATITISNVVAGHLLWLGVATNIAPTITSVVDSSGNTVLNAVPFGGSSGASLGQYYVENASAGTHTFTVTINTAANINLFAAEYPGVGTGRLDGVPPTIATGTGTAVTTNSATPGVSGDFAVSLINAATATPTISAWTNGFTQEQVRSGGPTCAFSDKLVGDTSATSTAATLSVSEVWGASIALFKASGTTGTTYTLNAATGIFSVSGEAALRDLALPANVGTFALTGFGTKAQRAFAAQAGTFGLTGNAATLTWSGAPSGLPDPGNLRYKLVFEVNPSGRVQWVSYIPIKYVVVTAAQANRFDTNGAIAVKTLTSVTGLREWVDYIPVVQSSNTKAWRYDDLGYIPVVKLT